MRPSVQPHVSWSHGSGAARSASGGSYRLYRLPLARLGASGAVRTGGRAHQRELVRRLLPQHPVWTRQRRRADPLLAVLGAAPAVVYGYSLRRHKPASFSLASLIIPRSAQKHKEAPLSWQGVPPCVISPKKGLVARLGRGNDRFDGDDNGSRGHQQRKATDHAHHILRQHLRYIVNGREPLRETPDA